MMNLEGTTETTRPKGEHSGSKGLRGRRVKTIMKSSANAGIITLESLHIMTKATEKFIQYLSRNSYKNAQTKNSSLLKYDHVSDFTNSQSGLDWLYRVLPRKITIRQYKEILAKISINESEESSESDDEPESNRDTKKSPKKLT